MNPEYQPHFTQAGESDLNREVHARESVNRNEKNTPMEAPTLQASLAPDHELLDPQYKQILSDAFVELTTWVKTLVQFEEDSSIIGLMNCLLAELITVLRMEAPAAEKGWSDELLSFKTAVMQITFEIYEILYKESERFSIDKKAVSDGNLSQVVKVPMKDVVQLVDLTPLEESDKLVKIGSMGNPQVLTSQVGAHVLGELFKKFLHFANLLIFHRNGDTKTHLSLDRRDKGFFEELRRLLKSSLPAGNTEIFQHFKEITRSNEGETLISYDEGDQSIVMDLLTGIHTEMKRDNNIFRYSDAASIDLFINLLKTLHWITPRQLATLRDYLQIIWSNAPAESEPGKTLQVLTNALQGVPPDKMNTDSALLGKLTSEIDHSQYGRRPNTTWIHIFRTIVGVERFEVMEEYLKRRFAYQAVINGYDMSERIGAGAMGEVYKGVGADGKELAIKVSLGEKSAEARKRSEREAEMARAFKHAPSRVIAESEFTISWGELVVIALRYIATRKNLHDVCREKDKLPLDFIIMQYQCALQALCLAHLEGIVHGDIKPANIMVDEDGTGVMTDWGMARIYDKKQDMRFNPRGRMIIAGTPHYMPPEQLERGFNGLDFKADIYSLALSFWVLLMKRPPYKFPSAPDPKNLSSSALNDARHEHLKSICRQRQDELLPWDEIINSYPKIPQSFIALMKRMSDPDPDKRPSCFESLREVSNIFPQYGEIQFPDGVDFEGIVPRPELDVIGGGMVTLSKVLPEISEEHMNVTQLNKIHDILIMLNGKLIEFTESDNPLQKSVRKMGRDINKLIQGGGSPHETQYRLHVKSLRKNLEALKKEFDVWYRTKHGLYSTLRQFFSDLDIAAIYIAAKPTMDYQPSNAVSPESLFDATGAASIRPLMSVANDPYHSFDREFSHGEENNFSVSFSASPADESESHAEAIAEALPLDSSASGTVPSGRMIDSSGGLGDKWNDDMYEGGDVSIPDDIGVGIPVTPDDLFQQQMDNVFSGLATGTGHASHTEFAVPADPWGDTDKGDEHPPAQVDDDLTMRSLDSTSPTELGASFATAFGNPEASSDDHNIAHISGDTHVRVAGIFNSSTTDDADDNVDDLEVVEEDGVDDLEAVNEWADSDLVPKADSGRFSAINVNIPSDQLLKPLPPQGIFPPPSPVPNLEDPFAIPILDPTTEAQRDNKTNHAIDANGLLANGGDKEDNSVPDKKKASDEHGSFDEF